MTYLSSMPDAGLKEVLRMEPALGLPIAEYHQALLRGPSPFTEGERELIGGYISGLNACGFCYGEHQAVAEKMGIEAGLMKSLMEDIDTAPVEEKLRVVLKFVKKLNDTPGRMTAADADAVRAAGWDDTALYHAVSICALFNMNNRIINGLGIPAHDPSALDGIATRLVDRGYDSTIGFIKGEWK
jgi:uncharacterized peroxidase-related enzyme